ncbi:MAG: DUF547 domain-containing protein [Candidatus Heimdallarchaeota archaeon]|nr:DUF547 domain-containing protein [Candidatus Heimdallarchaeota archaeon]
MIKKVKSLINPSLSHWIDKNGRVDYQSLKEDKWFWKQIDKIETMDLTDKTEKERFAFWLNAYNFLTIKGVLDKLEKKPNWNGNTSFIGRILFFYFKRFKVANRKMSLYRLENKILRKRFRDPRIHFVINCGSSSCPFLPGNMFEANSLDETLDGLTSFFINSQTNVYLDEKDAILYLNKIFKWYKKDFKKEGGIIEFIKKYWKGPKEKLDNVKIKYKKYDWSLNNQANEK